MVWFVKNMRKLFYVFAATALATAILTMVIIPEQPSNNAVCLGFSSAIAIIAIISVIRYAIGRTFLSKSVKFFVMILSLTIWFTVMHIARILIPDLDLSENFFLIYALAGCAFGSVVRIILTQRYLQPNELTDIEVQ